MPLHELIIKCPSPVFEERVEFNSPDAPWREKIAPQLAAFPHSLIVVADRAAQGQFRKWFAFQVAFDVIIFSCKSTQGQVFNPACIGKPLIGTERVAAFAGSDCTREVDETGGKMCKKTKIAVNIEGSIDQGSVNKLLVAGRNNALTVTGKFCLAETEFQVFGWIIIDHGIPDNVGASVHY